MTQESTEIEIRQAVEADRDTLAKLIVRAFADVTTNRSREEQFGLIGGRTWDEWEADIMRTIDVDRVIVAEAAGTAVGFATYELDDATRIGTVSDNAVLPEFRGRGIGAQLLARVLGLLEEAGMEFAEVSTGSDDPYTPARRMYERQGFRPYFRSVYYMKKLKQGAV
ncbi:MAG: GNAT family N-acetyltransferase [Chloroflexota bacterium]|nr:GNAT family N-acetyltransferase [Chloroflexota bacterium]MDE2840342.1 GNAT family N-acetyltransferase [Chloroflexota bacterium]MDE2929295.1 GNAT family N-acetyltransferase [Chloroflexota bacterium]